MGNWICHINVYIAVLNGIKFNLTLNFKIVKKDNV